MDLSAEERALFLGLLAEQKIAVAPVEVISRKARSDKTPLSFAQQRLWFLDQLIPNSPLYNVPIAARLQGRLDLTALDQSLNEIVRRHEVLRTTFRVIAEQPVQAITPTAHLELPIIHLQRLPQAVREAAARRLAAEEAGRPFDLSKDGMLRVHLLCLSPEDHVVLLTMHHISSDGWSLGILIREVATLFHAYSRDLPSPLEELAIQYADYAVWQREWLQGEVLEAQLAYWKQRLADVPPLLDLPLDHPRPLVQSFRGATQSMNLSPALLTALTELSQQHGMTLFMILLAAFQALLARYTRQEDIAIGTPVAGRNRAELEGLIGFFANTLVMRTDLSGNPSFAEVLRRVREVALEAYAHQDLPFERLVEELQPERGLGSNPIFQVMMVLQNAPAETLELPGLTLSLLPNECRTAKFDLTVFLEETNSGLGVSLEYSIDLFEADTISRLLGHYQRLLESVTADPECRLSDLELLTAEEREQLLVEWNETSVSLKTTSLVSLFENQVERTPDALAVEFGDQQLSYRELNRRANNLAHHLRDLGVRPDARVGICLERSCEMVIAVLGVLKAGGGYVPLDPAYPSKRLNFMIADAQCAVTLTSETVAAALLASENDQNPQIQIEPENIAYVIYTSGSTGLPKGVVMTHGAVRNLIDWHLDKLAGPAKTLQFASLSFDVSFQEIFSTWCTGGTLLLVTEELRRDTKAMLHVLAEWQVERFFLPFVYLQHLAEADAERGPAPLSLRDIVASGERLEITTQIAQFCERTHCRLHNHYGPSETHVATSYVLSGSADGWPTLPPIGRPIANSQIYILEPAREPAPIGVAGEVCIGGAGVARGYWNRPDLTAERFTPNPFSNVAGARCYSTGDLARYSPDGEIQFLGRVDTQVKLRGFRIELGEIEATLRKHPQVVHAVVVAKQVHPGDKRLIAYIVANGDSIASSSELTAYLKSRLPDFMIPAAWVMLDQLPLTASGKVLRSALPDPGSGRFDAPEMLAAPRTVIEEVLAGIWQQVLGLERVSRNENFFWLGGHSLMATRTVSRIREVFHVELQVRNVFEAPTIAELSEQIEELMKSGVSLEAPALRPRASKVHLPLSYAQQRLWFMDRLIPDSNAYNLPTGMYLDGSLNLAALEQSLFEVVRRHEVLRTTFAETGDGPEQVIRPAEFVNLPLVTLSVLNEGEQNIAAERLRDEDALRAFDLSTGPLLRVTLVRLNRHRHLLIANMHHIISDGWSLDILLNEIETLYESFSQGRPAPLVELEIQYADYALWQRDWLQGEVLQAHVRYWKQELAGASRVLELETDHARPTMRTRGSAHCPLTFSEDVSSSLRDFSRQEGVTLFMTLMAGFHALMQRYTGQQDIVVGTPMAGRNRVEVEPLIGFFVNMIPIRTTFNKDTTFRELVKQVREAALGAHTHQDLPFDKLVEELQPERSLWSSPLFQVIFAFQKVPSGISASAETKFDLEVFLNDTPAGVTGVFIYSPELFEPGSINRMVERFQRLIEKAVTEPEALLSSLPLLNEAEYRQVVEEWNDTEAPFPASCIQQIFEQEAAQRPDAIALEFEQENISYGELNRSANRLAQQLRKEGVGPEVFVGVMLERSTELIVALLAVAKAGGVYVPINLSDPAPRVQFILEDAGIKVIVTSTQFADNLAKDKVAIVRVDSSEYRGAAVEVEFAANADSGVAPQNLAYLLYTSGSTGTPKGVCITHRNVLGLVKSANFADLSPEEIFFQFAPVSFDASTWEIWVPLLNGARLVVFPPVLPSVSQLADFINRTQITTLGLTTGVFHQFADANLMSFGAVRKLLTGGDALSPTHLNKVMEQSDGCLLLNCYGPTESTVMACCYEVGPERPAISVPIGRPVSNAQVYVINGMQPVGIGERGEIFIGGAGLGRGYLNRPDLTAERFLPDPFGVRPGERLYRTGDAARYLNQGLIQFLGRLDDQVKISGYRIEPGEIEAVLLKHPTVTTATVVAWEGSTGDKRLAAYVVANEGAAVSMRELKDYLKERLPGYMVPAAIVTLEALPLTPNGKLDRQALPQPKFTAAAWRAARTPQEEILCSLFAEALNLPRVGLDDNFFDLGGHSLLAIRIVSRVRESFQVELPVRSLFESPTVAESAERIEELMRSSSSPKAPPLLPRSVTDRLPLSYAQQRLWFLDQLMPGNNAYNLPSGIRLSGSLNLTALKQSLSEIVRGHEALRTNFTNVDGQPIQTIAPVQPQQLPIVNLERLTEEERESVVQRLALAESQRPFDLSKDSLFRTSLFRLSDQEHVMLAVMHHIISDAWSMEILIRDVPLLYRAFCLGQPSPLPELPIQYADYALWQRQWLQGDALEAERAYWRNQLEGSPPILSLPTDRARPSTLSLKGNAVSLEVPQWLLEKLKQLSQAEGATLFITLLASFQMLLSRYSGQDDIPVGTPVTGRRWIETENLIGFLVNTLLIRTKLYGNLSIREALRRVREVVFEAHTHQDLPFERLVEELQPERTLSHGPLFQVMFVFQNVVRPPVEIGNLVLSDLGLNHGAEKIDLTFRIAEDRNRLHCSFSYSTDLFDESTIERLGAHWLRLLAAMVTDPEQLLRDVELLSHDERQEMLVEWNATKSEFPETVCLQELFDSQVKRTPDAIAVSFEDQQLSYSELQSRANHLAHHLRKIGIGPDTAVAIYLKRSLSTMVAVLGVLKAGGAYLPIDTGYPKARVLHMLQDAQVVLILTEEQLAATLPQHSAARLYLDSDWPSVAAEPEVNPPLTTHAENLAYVIYTSGSTGAATGVMVQHRSVVNLASSLRTGIYPNNETPLRVSVNAPLMFDSSVKQLVQLLYGHELCIVPEEVRMDGREMHAYLQRHAVDVLDCTPSQLRLMLSSGFSASAAPVPSLALVGGEAIDEDTWRRLAVNEQTTFINVYGPTECTVDATACRIESYSRPTIGRPINNVQTYLLDRHLRPVPIGVEGELFIGGAGVGRGYLANPALTAERFVPDPFSGNRGARLYRSGDLARYRANGEIDFLGRLDFQVKIRGHRIEPGEVEAALSKNPKVRQAVVLDRGFGPDKRLVAYVVARENSATTSAELNSYLKERLPRFMVPTSWVMLDELPLTPNGKVNRAALPELSHSLNRLAGEYIAPRNYLQEQLVEIWEDLLNIHPIGVTDNFFELGGHSLMMIMLFTRIEEALGKRIQMGALFSEATIEYLSQLISGDMNENVFQSLVVPMQTQGTNPPLFTPHAAGGHVWCYKDLARHIGDDQPFYGLQTLELETGLVVEATIENMAANYVEAIRRVQPVGPYLLGGWSMGGVVAFEMARQLQQQGQQIGLLALIDSQAPVDQQSKYSGRELLPYFARDLGLTGDNLRMPVAEESAVRPITQREVWKEARLGGLIPSDMTLLEFVKVLTTFKINLNTVRRYQPEKYQGRVTLFRAEQNQKQDNFSDDLNGWEKLADGGVALHVVPGDHFSMVREPHVKVLAELLRSCIHNALQKSPAQKP